MEGARGGLRARITLYHVVGEIQIFCLDLPPLLFINLLYSYHLELASSVTLALLSVLGQLLIAMDLNFHLISENRFK